MSFNHNITVFKAHTISRQSGNDSYCISFEELKKWIKNGSFIKHLFRYKKVTLITCRLEALPKPFLTAVLLLLISQGNCVWRDELGNSKKINFKSLLGYFLAFLKDLKRKDSILKTITKECNLLLNQINLKKTLRLTNRPIYLRTDLVFGLKSGGSVGHIAGVLNNIDYFSQNPIFISSDFIPTVREDIEKHFISPEIFYWDFPDIPSFVFNEKFYHVSNSILEKHPLSFIYQRYSTNNFSGVKLANQYNVPFILEYNGSEIWINRHWGKPLKHEKLSEKIEMLNLKAADLIVVVSSPMKRELLARGINEEKILVNPNGVDPQKYSPNIDGSKIKKQLNIENKFVFGFIGTFGKWHGAENLVESFAIALKQFPNLKESAKLLLIGDGAQKSAAENIAKAQNIKDFVIFTGLVPQEVGPQYLASCDVLVSPHVPNPDGTAFFGSPTKLFEYMAMGKPIIASDLDQIGEILSHKKTAWMVPPGNKDVLAEAFSIIYMDEKIRNSLGNAARQEVINKYTWKIHTQKIMDRLKEIMA